jgi:DNA (cytosine-5)-methyltransferase 1
MTPILANTYFSGAGLTDLGPQGWRSDLATSFEIEALCCDTMRRNFSHEVVQCDITKKLVSSERECHVMVATYPCTKYSPIGDIHGVRTGDDLFLHFFRHVAINRPELYVVENVPGMKKFPVVMEAMTQLPDYYVHVACPVKSFRSGCRKREID